MKIALIYLFSFLIIIIKSNAADFTVRFSTGYNDYNFSALKETQYYTIYSYQINEIDFKIVDDFPANIVTGFELNYQALSSLYISLFYSFSSTGGRLHIADYSGELKLDQVLYFSNLGLGIDILITENLNQALFTYIKISKIHVSLENSEYKSIIGYRKKKRVTEYSTASYGTEIGLSVRHSYKKYHFSSSVGYQFAPTIILGGNDEKGQLIQFPKGTKFKSDLSGFKYIFSIGYVFQI